MNPDLRARTNSRIMLLAKHPPQICAWGWGVGGGWMMWRLDCKKMMHSL